MDESHVFADERVFFGQEEIMEASMTLCNPWKCIWGIALLMCALIMQVTDVRGQVPPVMNYQGRLIAAGGGPVTGNVTVTLNVYSDPWGTNVVYSEHIGEVQTFDGICQFPWGANGTSQVFSTEIMGYGNGAQSIFNYNVQNPPIRPGTTFISDGYYQWSAVWGSSHPAEFIGNVVLTGRVSAIYLNNPPPPGAAISVTYGTQIIGISMGLLQSAEMWIQLVVNGDLLWPRQKLSSVPYALLSKQAEGVVPGGVTSQMIAPAAVKSNQIDWATMPPAQNQWIPVSGTNIQVSSGQWLLPDPYGLNIIRLPCPLPRGFSFRVYGGNWALKLNTPEQRDHLLYSFGFTELTGGYFYPLWIRQIDPVLTNDAGALLPPIDIPIYYGEFDIYSLKSMPVAHDFICAIDNLIQLSSYSRGDLDDASGTEFGPYQYYMAYGYGYGYCYGSGSGLSTNTNSLTISRAYIDNDDYEVKASGEENGRFSKIYTTKAWLSKTGI